MAVPDDDVLSLSELQQHNYDENRRWADSLAVSDRIIIRFTERFENEDIEIDLSAGEVAVMLKSSADWFAYRKYGGHEPLRHGALGANVYVFCARFLDEIRECICPKQKGKAVVGPTTSAAIAGLTHWIAEHFQVTPEDAKALATAALIVLASITKGAFCRMAMEEARAAVKKQESPVHIWKKLPRD
jgi:hypothetical protein